MTTRLLVYTILLLLLPHGAANAEEGGDQSVLSVRELSSHGQHIEALRAYLSKDDVTVTLSDRLSAAKSAWALGLVDRARQYWDEALATRNFVGTERERELLGRAILELQEGNHEEARARGERAISSLPASPVRGQFYLLIAESLRAQGAYSQAEDYYRRAIDEVSPEDRSEAYFLLGESQLKLGLLNEARYSFSEVNSRSKYSSQSLRKLAEIDLSQRNFDGVLMWIAEGREMNPQEFEEPWVAYAQIYSLLETNQRDAALKELEQFRVRHSERDTWFGLAAAAIESSLAREAAVHGRRKQG